MRSELVRLNASKKFVPAANWYSGFSRDPVLTSVSQYTGQPLTREFMLSCVNTRMICANFDLLAADFRELLMPPHGLAAGEGVLDEQWCRRVSARLLSDVSFISKPQAAQSVTNTPVNLGADEREVFRPPRYGRAAVMRLLSDAGICEGLIDVKGCGVPPDEVPTLPNSNGLLTLSEAVHEFTMERLVYAALYHAGSPVLTVPCYGIVDLGFDALFHDGRPPQRAVLLLRRAVTRPRFQWGKTPPGSLVARQLLDIEMMLRRYGISGSICGAVRFHIADSAAGLDVTRDGKPLPFDDSERDQIRAQYPRNGADHVIVDGVNIQVSDGLPADPNRARVMDFGRYRFCNRFESIAYSWCEADYQNLRGEVLLPTDAAYAQPDPRLNMAWVMDHEIARDLERAVVLYQEGTIDAVELTGAMEQYVNAACRGLSEHPR